MWIDALRARQDSAGLVLPEKCDWEDHGKMKGELPWAWRSLILRPRRPSRKRRKPDRRLSTRARVSQPILTACSAGCRTILWDSLATTWSTNVFGAQPTFGRQPKSIFATQAGR